MTEEQKARLIAKIAGDDALCNDCPETEYGQTRINTGPWDLCEGRSCEQAIDHYLKRVEDENLVEELLEEE